MLGVAHSVSLILNRAGRRWMSLTLIPNSGAVGAHLFKDHSRQFILNIRGVQPENRRLSHVGLFDEPFKQATYHGDLSRAYLFSGISQCFHNVGQHLNAHDAALVHSVRY